MSALTGDAKWREKALEDIEAFTSGRTPAIAEPYRLTSLAGALAFADAASLAGDKQAGALAETVAARMVEGAGEAGVNFATGWTDDMFMASSVLSRTANGVHADVVGKLLTAYAKKLQRPDGLFIHAENGPHAWGRGNGFALLGLTEALTHLPSSWSARPQVLETLSTSCRGNGETSVRRWQLAPGGGRAGELSRADRHRDDHRRAGARHRARLDRSHRPTNRS